MRRLYSILFYLLIPFVLLRIAIKGLRNPGYLKRIKERFGFFQAPDQSGGIWLHAVSVGETIAAVPLIKRIQALYPKLLITVTTMTPTGSDRLRALLKDSVFHVYVPYDIPFAVQRFLMKIKPTALIIMETEIWPNIIHFSRKQKIPIMLINARLSARSAKKYAKFPQISAHLFHQFHWIATQYEADAARYIALGAKPDKVLTLGSIKFDQPLPNDIQAKASDFRRPWQERLVWIAASTHEGEEELVLAAFAEVKQHLPRTLLFLVPRHPERFTRVANLCRKQGYHVQLRSSIDTSFSPEVDIVIGDSMGELLLFYAASDLAFVGGSLVSTGGHNILEPAALGLAVLTGMHVFNFNEIALILEEAGALVKVADSKALAAKVVYLLQNPAERCAMGSKGKAIVAQHRGAMDRYLSLISETIMDVTKN